MGKCNELISKFVNKDKQISRTSDESDKEYLIKIVIDYDTDQKDIQKNWQPQM